MIVRILGGAFALVAALGAPAAAQTYNAPTGPQGQFSGSSPTETQVLPNTATRGGSQAAPARARTSGATLPRTGSESSDLLLYGVGATGIGLMLVAAGRRRTAEVVA